MFLMHYCPRGFLPLVLQLHLGLTQLLWVDKSEVSGEFCVGQTKPPPHFPQTQLLHECLVLGRGGGRGAFSLCLCAHRPGLRWGGCLQGETLDRGVTLHLLPCALKTHHTLGV